MTTKDEALKLALEALEYIDLCDNDRDFLHPHECFQLDEVITAIKQALADSALDRMAENARELGLDYEPAPVQEPLSFNCSAGCGACGVKLKDFVTHQTQAQEGDEWVVVNTEPQIVSTCCGSPVEVWDERKQDITASVEATPPADEIQRLSALVRAQQITIDKLEATPAPEERKRPWVHATPWRGLTDEEIKTVIVKIDPNEHYLPNSLRQLSLALEAKLKEKNCD